MRKFLTVAVLVAVAACGAEEAETPDTLRLMAHDSFAGSVSEETFAGFTETTGIEVEMIAAGDAGSMVNQAALSKDNPLADVMFGVDDTFLSRAIDEEIFAEHRSDLLGEVGDQFVPDTDLVTPIDYGDVCINYDKSWFAEAGTTVPTELDQLRDPALCRSADCRAPRHLFTGSGLSPRHHRRVRGRWLARVLVRPQGWRCRRRPGLGHRLLQRLHAVRWRQPDGRLVCLVAASRGRLRQ